MTDNYTPTTEKVRSDYAETYEGTNERRYAAFDRWLASVEREAAARALSEAADAWTQGAWSNSLPPRDAIRPQIILGTAQAAGDFLRARAAEIREAKSE